MSNYSNNQFNESPLTILYDIKYNQLSIII